MYFHLIGIKEKNGEKHDLDMLLQGGDEDFIRKFLANRGVVIVSITEFKDDPKNFGNIFISTKYEDTEISILVNGETVEKSAYFFMLLGLEVVSINYTDNSISESQVKQIIDTTILQINEENEAFKKQQELAELNEQKKYEESGIKDGLKILNSNIDRIEQIMKAGDGILSGSEIKQLETYLNEMKRIRLGTNFNKMASLVLDTHILLKKAEEQIFTTYDSKKFPIDKNSSVTNIDVLSEYFASNIRSEKSKLQPAGLTPSESLLNFFGENSMFVGLLKRDIDVTFKSISYNDFFDITISLIEFLVLTIIVVMSLFWLIALLLGYGNFSLYLLPAMGRLGLLIYLLNNLKLEGIIAKLASFFVLAIIYWRGLILLLNTFAL